MAYIEIEPLHGGETVGEFVDKINEIIAALNEYRPVTNYADLEGKPTIEGHELNGEMHTADLHLDLSENEAIRALETRITANETAINGHTTSIGNLTDSIPDDTDIVAACEQVFVRKDLTNVEETVMAGKDGYLPVVGANGEVGKMKLENATAMVTTMQEASKSAAETVLKEKRTYIPVEYTAGSADVTAATAFRNGTTALYINGVLQAEGTDYTCTDNTTIALLTYVPVSGDIIQLMAIPAA